MMTNDERDERTASAPSSPHAEMAQRLRRMAAEVYHFSAAIASGMDDIADQLDAKPEQPPVTAQELRDKILYWMSGVVREYEHRAEDDKALDDIISDWMERPQ